MRLFLATVAALASVSVLAAANPVKEEVKGPLQFKMKDIDGKEVDLSTYKGKVVLIVNVASKCGNTPQYKTLEDLYEKNKDAGLVIIGVPANEFNKQEPGTDAEIKEFCTSKYNVTFPMMSKVVVKGEGIAPLYKFLTEKETNPNFAGPITWNFEKFLINRKGEVVKRFTPKTKPDSEDVTKAIKAELDAK
jgi:glutathione peroxidase